MTTPPIQTQAHALRQEFDATFAAAPRTGVETPQSFLAIRLGGDPYAIRIADISGLHVERRIMALPTPVAQLLGLAGFRGQVAAVYDLASLCGYARAVSQRWMVLLRAQEPIALAFETFDMHFLALPHQLVHTQEAGTAANRVASAHLQGAVRQGDVVRPIIQLQSVLADIRQRSSAPTPKRSPAP